MRSGHSIAVVVPAFNEAERVARVVTRIPGWVDLIVVVDDGSRDATAQAVDEADRRGRTVVVRHGENRGVGAAIVTGYREAAAAGADVVAVMAGDDQMDPADLAAVVSPVVAGRAAYVKGNRFLHAERRQMPFARRIAGRVLALFTRIATGLVIDDSQCGYTALSARAARALPLDDLWPRYGYPNDLLGMLAAQRLPVLEVPVRPVYAGERSGVRPWHALVVAIIIARRWLKSRRHGRAESAPFAPAPSSFSGYVRGRNAPVAAVTTRWRAR
ncbi:MAG TPA: glycosyltransferase family 2 protein [Polyangiaceae bacterium]|nr:glycosyltransferase family 2 protein [Polyangiaceae bacterium]